jgi:uncharacterized membrane protein
MKYLIITYYKKSNGQYDESVAVTNRLKTFDLATASVVLDFKNQTVVKCSMNGVTVPKNWQKIRDFYHQHYARYIDQLEHYYNTAID